MARPCTTILVHELHGDVVGGVDHEVGDEDVEEVGGDGGPGDGPVQDQEQVDPVDQRDQDHVPRRPRVLPGAQFNRLIEFCVQIWSKFLDKFCALQV